jgi:proteic killer suppression protein
MLEIRLARFAAKQLRKAPRVIQLKLRDWVNAIQDYGLAEVRQQPGYHDEPLKGRREGQRSVRLNRQWRAIYTLEADDSITLITIEEVTPHDY